MSDTMPPESRRLHAALVAVYPAHVRRRAGDRAVPGLGEAIDQGTAWLEETLSRLLSLPFPEQRRGPLEVFQEAMRFPTDALRAAGEPPVARDPVTEAALPGDAYDLAPASPRDLGEDVWAVHLAWGAAKAAAITGGERPAPDDAGR